MFCVIVAPTCACIGSPASGIRHLLLGVSTISSRFDVLSHLPMAQSAESPILAQLRAAKTYPDQTAALRALKNEIVGHIQKKEAWISLGVLQPIVRTLSTDPSPNEHNTKDFRLLSSTVPLSDEDDVKLQALQLVASFANGMSCISTSPGMEYLINSRPWH